MLLAVKVEDESVLISRAQDGDREAFGELVMFDAEPRSASAEGRHAREGGYAGDVHGEWLISKPLLNTIDVVLVMFVESPASRARGTDPLDRSLALFVLTATPFALRKYPLLVLMFTP